MEKLYANIEHFQDKRIALEIDRNCNALSDHNNTKRDILYNIINVNEMVLCVDHW